MPDEDDHLRDQKDGNTKPADQPTHGRKLFNLGYDVTPIAPPTCKAGHIGSPGKSPATWTGREWKNRSLYNQFVWGKSVDLWPECGVGIVLHSGVIGIDVDVLDYDVSRSLYRLIKAELGAENLFCRIGKEPKFLVVVRAAEGEAIDYQASSRFTHDGNDHRVEVLAGVRQFVAYGQHPSGAIYRWPDREPIEVTPDELPAVTNKWIRELIAKADDLMRQAGWPVTAPKAGSSTMPRRPLSDIIEQSQKAGGPEQALKILARLDGEDDYHAWISVMYQIIGTFGTTEEGLDAWLNWSQKSPKYNDMHAREVWKRACKRVRLPLERGGGLSHGLDTLITKLMPKVHEELARKAAAITWKDLVDGRSE